jgi:hypothetical protein
MELSTAVCGNFVYFSATLLAGWGRGGNSVAKVAQCDTYLPQMAKGCVPILLGEPYRMVILSNLSSYQVHDDIAVQSKDLSALRIRS